MANIICDDIDFQLESEEFDRIFAKVVEEEKKKPKVNIISNIQVVQPKPSPVGGKNKQSGSKLKNILKGETPYKRKSGGEKRNTKCNKEKQEQQPHHELLQQLQQESQPVQHPQQQQQQQQEEQTFDDYLSEEERNLFAQVVRIKEQFLDEFKQIELSVVEARETLALQQLELQIREERLKKCEHRMRTILSLLK